MSSQRPTLDTRRATRIIESLTEFGISDEDWLILGRLRPNVLFVGPDSETSRVIQALLPSLQKPVAWCASPAFALPDGRAETLILQNASGLERDAQDRLLHWLQQDAHPSLQIVTTTPVSLLPRVDQGLFLDALYYRLNVMCVFVGV